MIWIFILLAAGLVFLGVGKTFKLIGAGIGVILLGTLLYVLACMAFIGLLTLL